jgi:hypothetical protein
MRLPTSIDSYIASVQGVRENPRFKGLRISGADKAAYGLMFVISLLSMVLVPIMFDIRNLLALGFFLGVSIYQFSITYYQVYTKKAISTSMMDALVAEPDLMIASNKALGVISLACLPTLALFSVILSGYIFFPNNDVVLIVLLFVMLIGLFMIMDNTIARSVLLASTKAVVKIGGASWLLFFIPVLFIIPLSYIGRLYATVDFGYLAAVILKTIAYVGLRKALIDHIEYQEEKRFTRIEPLNY